jgi:hypothetical protein
VIAVVPLSSNKVNLRIGSVSEAAYGVMVSGDFFSGLQVGFALGQGFTTRDETDHAQVIVLSYKYWTRRFSRNSSILGENVFVKGVPFKTIRGLWGWNSYLALRVLITTCPSTGTYLGNGGEAAIAMSAAYSGPFV